MPQGDGGSASREHERSQQLVLTSASSDLASNRILLNTFPEGARGRVLSYDDLSRCFHLPINAAAKELGVCVTALKKQCRKHGIQRWPHRNLKSLDKLKEKLEKEEATAADKEYYKHEIHSIAQKKDHIFRSSAANASSTNSQGDMGVSHHSGGAPGSSLHPRPSQQMVRRPFSHFPNGADKAVSQPMARYASAQGAPPAVVPGVPFGVDSEHQQVAPPSMYLPFSHMPANQTAAVHGPSGAVLAQPASSTPQYPFCGFYGCDCYMNNGVSSRVYHPPLAPTRTTNGVGQVSNSSPNNSGAGAGGVNVPHPQAPGGANVHFYNAPTYAYGPAVAHVPPYQNMVQVNVVEQPPFPHGSGGSQASGVPMGGPPTSSPVAQSQAMLHGPGPSVAGAPGFDVYSNRHPAGVNPSAGTILYAPFPPPGVPYDGVVAHQASGSGVAAYWADMHNSQAPSNVVTMCNQTVHHHHPAPETAATTSPALAQGSGRRATAGTSSSTTHDSGARAVPSSADHKDKKIEKDEEPASEGRKDTSAPPSGDKSRLENASPAQSPHTSSVLTARAQAKETGNTSTGGSGGKRGSVCVADLDEAHRSDDQKKYHANPEESGAEKSFSSETDGEQKQDTGGSLRITTRASERVDAVRTGHRATDSDSNLTDSEDGAPRRARRLSRPSKRPRVHVSGFSNVTGTWQDKLAPGQRADRGAEHKARDTSDIGDASSSAREVTPEDQDNGTGSGSGSRNHDEDGDGEDSGAVKNDSVDAKRLCKLPEGGDGPLKRDIVSPSEVAVRNGQAEDSPNTSVHRKENELLGISGSSQPSTASVIIRARRYDHVVHQCLGLQAAQWCTDLNFRVTLALGPKALLGLAGVPSLGKSVLDSTDSALESKHSTKTKYGLACKGQRLEWIAAKGSSQYLMVMTPFRRRNNAEISGVSGLMIELKIIQALAN